MAAASGRPQITKPSRFIAAAKAGEDNLIEEYLNDRTKNIDVNKVCLPHHPVFSLSLCVRFLFDVFTLFVCL